MYDTNDIISNELGHADGRNSHLSHDALKTGQLERFFAGERERRQGFDCQTWLFALLYYDIETQKHSLEISQHLIIFRLAMYDLPSLVTKTLLCCRSKVEILKENSDYLRHPLMSELVSETTNINEEAGQLMKFHGSYQQDNREKRTLGQGKFYQFMMRTRQPAGVVTNKLYLTMDDLSDVVSYYLCKIEHIVKPHWPVSTTIEALVHL